MASSIVIAIEGQVDRVGRHWVEIVDTVAEHLVCSALCFIDKIIIGFALILVKHLIIG